MNAKQIAVMIIAAAVLADLIGFGFYVLPTMNQQQVQQQQSVSPATTNDAITNSLEIPASTEAPESKKEEPRDMSDIDLTDMSSTMVLTTAWDLTGSPSRYAGRKLRMKGAYEEYTDKNGVLHHSVLVKDAMGCCSQGVEFELADGAYPAKGTEVLVDGVLSTYKAPDPQLPDWVNKADPRYDGVLNVTIVRDAVIVG